MARLLPGSPYHARSLGMPLPPAEAPSPALSTGPHMTPTRRLAPPSPGARRERVAVPLLTVAGCSEALASGDLKVRRSRPAGPSVRTATEIRDASHQHVSGRPTPSYVMWSRPTARPGRRLKACEARLRTGPDAARSGGGVQLRPVSPNVGDGDHDASRPPRSSQGGRCAGRRLLAARGSESGGCPAADWPRPTNAAERAPGLRAKKGRLVSVAPVISSASLGSAHQRRPVLLPRSLFAAARFLRL